MKRFIIDFLLIIILVMLGSSIDTSPSVDEQILEYENNIENIPVHQNTKNKATIFIKESGEFIEIIISFSVEVISSIFKAVIE